MVALHVDRHSAMIQTGYKISNSVTFYARTHEKNKRRNQGRKEARQFSLSCVRWAIGTRKSFTPAERSEARLSPGRSGLDHYPLRGSSS